MTQIEFDQKILELRKETNEKMRPIQERLTKIEIDIFEVQFQQENLRLKMIELKREKFNLNERMKEMNRQYLDEKTSLNMQLNEYSKFKNWKQENIYVEDPV